MEVRILGPLEVLHRGEPLPLGGPRDRSLLVFLASHAGEAVSIDRLIDAVWGDDLPGDPEHALQAAISRLRKTLQVSGDAPEFLVRRSPGYVLDVETEQVDAARFERLVENALHLEDPAARVAALTEALSLWGGSPLADVTYQSWAQPEITRLEEIRHRAIEEEIDAHLILGSHADVLGRLRALVEEHPLRERLRGQLMLALYRAGRQAEALSVYEETRQVLVEDLGVEPGPELKRIHLAILQQDPSLDWTPPRPPPTNIPERLTIFVGREEETRQLRSLESHTSAPTPAAASEEQELLATKFNVPRVASEFLTRSRLVDQLEGDMTWEMVLVCTPAGFGKTTLLADWARRTRRPVAWLSLDPDDNDPARFWRYLVEALDRTCPGLGEETLPLLTAPGAAAGPGVLTAVINELETMPEEVALVLDDYHVIESPAVQGGMTFLLDHLPAQLRVLIASRADPALPMARYRAGGRLAELRAAELRFTSEECAVLLREVWGLDLSAEEMASLEGRTEGWAVGLQLAALSLRQRPQTKAFLAAFTGSHRYVLDYLSEEVLEHQPDQVRAFLLQTSILERLSGPLCDAVTGRSDGQQMLEELDRANLFLTPLDDIRRWYRYHHLFADLLRSRLQQRHPESVPDLHRRAAGWCEQHGLVDQTIRHASAAGDLFWATRLVERHVEELLLRRSERATLDRWLSTLPAEMVAARPRLVLAQAIAAQIEGRLDDTRRLLATAQETSVDPDDPHEPSVGRAASVLANVAAVIPVIHAERARLTGEPERAAAFADEALSRLSPEDKLLGTFARYHLSVADWMLGRLEPAEQGLSRVVDERAAAGERYLAVRASYDLGCVQQAGGRLGAALNTYRKAQGIMTERGRRPPPETGLALVGIAEVLWKRGDLTNALLNATQAVERCRHLVYTPPLAAGLVTLAWIHQAMAEPARALEAMDEAQRTVPSPSVVSLLNPARSDWARLALVQGRVQEAVRWSEQRGMSHEDEISYPLEPDYLVLARVVLALDEPAAALRLLERLDLLAESQGRRGSLIQIRALRSLALQAAGDHQPALTMLAEALALARPEGYIRVFADEGPLMAALLGSLARQRQPATAVSTPVRKYLNRVLREFAPSGQPADHSAPAVADLIQPLTPREVEVLRLIAAGRRNQEIADELVVSLWTVKKHVSHIFDKLVAANRTEAVAQARQLGLLP